ncbi:MAG: hypothetical protein AB1714_17045 [Acidobacteriota bacterium]
MLLFHLALLVSGALNGAPTDSVIADKYDAPLRKVFSVREQVRGVHPMFDRLCPIAIAEDGKFHVFEPDEAASRYNLVRIAPAPFPVQVGLRASMPLDFYGNRATCCVTGEVFDEPDGYVMVLHEFVHCYQWETCERELKEKLDVYREAMKRNDFMWELQHPFPYTDEAFTATYGELLDALGGNESQRVEQLRARLKGKLARADWEYMTWEEWKEGLARYLENLVRRRLGLKENTGGLAKPFDRVTFYAGGELLIRSYARSDPGIVERLPELFDGIAGGGMPGEAPRASSTPGR